MNHRWEWIILSIRSLNVFEENIVVTVFAELVPLIFKCSYALFFLTCSLIDRCQIVTDTCKNNVSKFVWKPFKSPLSLHKKQQPKNVLKMLPSAYGLGQYFQDLNHSFSPYGPPSWQITYISYLILSELNVTQNYNVIYN